MARECWSCKIFPICVFNDRLREALSGDADKYMDDHIKALRDIEGVVAEHCIYFTPGEVSK